MADDGVLISRQLLARVGRVVREFERGSLRREGAGFGNRHDDFVLYDEEEPDTVGADDETEAAAEDSWDAEDEEASPNVDVVMVTRMAYNHAGDKKLYAYYRTLSFERGLLVKVSEETRVEIDAPEDC